MAKFNKKQYINEVTRNFNKLPKQIQILFFEILAFPQNDSILISDFINASDLDYSACESPIEQLFAMAFDYANLSNPAYLYIGREQQKEILANGRKYRVDFLIEDEILNNYKLIIECDGHEFHEKTKEQVAYGNQRDYDLKVAGYDVLHFSGNQINANPLKIATEVLNYVVAKERNKCPKLRE